MEYVPEELICQVLQLLTPCDACALSVVCTSWRAAFLQAVDSFEEFVMDERLCKLAEDLGRGGHWGTVNPNGNCLCSGV